MIPALIVFVVTYVLMLSFQKWRPWIALGAAAVMLVLGALGFFEMTRNSATQTGHFDTFFTRIIMTRRFWCHRRCRSSMGMSKET